MGRFNNNDQFLTSIRFVFHCLDNNGTIMEINHVGTKTAKRFNVNEVSCIEIDPDLSNKSNKEAE